MYRFTCFVVLSAAMLFGVGACGRQPKESAPILLKKGRVPMPAADAPQANRG